MSAGHVDGTGRRAGGSAPIVEHRANVVVVAQARPVGAGVARTHDLTDLRSTAQRRSTVLSGRTFRQAKQADRDGAGQPWCPAIGHKRGAIRRAPPRLALFPGGGECLPRDRRQGQQLVCAHDKALKSSGIVHDRHRAGLMPPHARCSPTCTCSCAARTNRAAGSGWNASPSRTGGCDASGTERAQVSSCRRTSSNCRPGDAPGTCGSPPLCGVPVPGSILR